MLLEQVTLHLSLFLKTLLSLKPELLMQPLIAGFVCQTSEEVFVYFGESVSFSRDRRLTRRYIFINLEENRERGPV